MSDIIDLEKLLLQKKEEQKKAQDAAASQGLVLGGPFEGFFNIKTGERMIWDDEEEAEVLEFPRRPEDEEN